VKVINIINLKGGVAKTISAINIAYVLAVKHGQRVLLIDNDKQGNASKFFRLYSYESLSIAEVLTEKDPNTLRHALKCTAYDNLHLLPANMNLLRADKTILLDVARPQQTRLKKALQGMEEAGYTYDYAVIDNAPDLNMSTINALVAADDVLIPIKIDQFAFDGLNQLREQVEETREFNPGIRIAGCFITMYARNNVNYRGKPWLANNIGIPVFKTVIRKTVKVDETTFAGVPLPAYAKNCTAARDYETLVEEYLKM
jgi:chromosome partitioning protein